MNSTRSYRRARQFQYQLQCNRTPEATALYTTTQKNQRHIDLKLQDKVSLKNNIFQICKNNKYIVSIEMIQDDECPIKGVINKIDDNKVIVSKLTEYGEDDGEAILKKENIDTISFLGVDEEDIQLLKRK